MTCKRNHSKWHQEKIPGRKGTWCSYILGVVGVESAGHKTIQCGDYPTDDLLPKNMLRLTP